MGEGDPYPEMGDGCSPLLFYGANHLRVYGRALACAFYKQTTSERREEGVQLLGCMRVLMPLFWAQDTGDDSSDESDDGESLSFGSGAKVVGIGGDISALGRLTSRASVLEYGLRDVVRNVQKMHGYRSYAEYEVAVMELVKQVQSSVSAQMALKTSAASANAEALMALCCELNQMLDDTAICKQVSKGKASWQAQRHFILHANGWEVGKSAVSSKEFKSQARLLQTCHRLYAGMDEDESISGSPFSKGGIFGTDGKAQRPAEPRKEDTRTCHNCGKMGHIARNCKKARDSSSFKCLRCGEMGHKAKDCDGVRTTN